MHPSFERKLQLIPSYHSTIQLYKFNNKTYIYCTGHIISIHLHSAVAITTNQMASQPKTALFRAKNQIALVGAECTTCELSPSTQWCPWLTTGHVRQLSSVHTMHGSMVARRNTFEGRRSKHCRTQLLFVYCTKLLKIEQFQPINNQIIFI